MSAAVQRIRFLWAWITFERYDRWVMPTIAILCGISEGVTTGFGQLIIVAAVLWWRIAEVDWRWRR